MQVQARVLMLKVKVKLELKLKLELERCSWEEKAEPCIQFWSSKLAEAEREELSRAARAEGKSQRIDRAQHVQVMGRKSPKIEMRLILRTACAMDEAK